MSNIIKESSSDEKFLDDIFNEARKRSRVADLTAKETREFEVPQAIVASLLPELKDEPLKGGDLEYTEGEADLPKYLYYTSSLRYNEVSNITVATTMNFLLDAPLQQSSQRQLELQDIKSTDKSVGMIHVTTSFFKGKAYPGLDGGGGFELFYDQFESPSKHELQPTEWLGGVDFFVYEDGQMWVGQDEEDAAEQNLAPDIAMQAKEWVKDTVPLLPRRDSIMANATRIATDLVQ